MSYKVEALPDSYAAEPYEGEEKPPWTSTVKDQSGEPTLE